MGLARPAPGMLALHASLTGWICHIGHYGRSKDSAKPELMVRAAPSPLGTGQTQSLESCLLLRAASSWMTTPTRSAGGAKAERGCSEEEPPHHSVFSGQWPLVEREKVWEEGTRSERCSMHLLWDTEQEGEDAWAPALCEH